MNSEEQICRVCYDVKGTTPDMEFISPCSCMGDQLFIHKKCFNQWINSDRNSSSYTKCPTCKNEYLRSKPDDFSDVIENKSLLTILTFTTGIFLLFLFIVLGCVSSTVFCSFAIFIFYLVAVFYCCGPANGFNNFYPIFIFYLLCLYSSPKIKLFFGVLWGILIFGLICYHLISEQWDKVNARISKEIMKNFGFKFYDFYLKKFVNL